MMATLIVEDTLLALAADPSVIVAGGATSIEEQSAGAGDVRRRAGGRFQSVSRPGVQSNLSIQCDIMDRADIDTLRSWINQTVLLRDPRGRKIWGVFYGLAVGEYAGADGGFARVAFNIEQVTVSEVV